MQTGERHQRLDRRTGRILALQRAIEQRPIRRRAQGLVKRTADAIDEGIGVIGRLADEGQDRAGVRDQHHDCTTIILERRYRSACQPRVQREMDVAARYRRRAFDHAQDAPLGVDLDFLIADPPVQDLFTGFLHAHLADMGGGRVVGLLDGREIRFTNAPDVADDMGEGVAQRIVTTPPRCQSP